MIRAPKQSGSGDLPKSNKFKISGLLKKSLSWRKSLDPAPPSLAMPVDTISSYNFNSSFEIPYGPSSTLAGPEFSNVSYSDPVSSATTESSSSFTTECISLHNSEMTSHFSIDGADNFQKSYFYSSVPQTIPVVLDEALEESSEDYKEGGYHPMKIGEVFDSDTNLYRVIRKLGWGHFSTVWLCSSLLNGDLVAIKIAKLGINYTEAARDEISILLLLQDDEESPEPLLQKNPYPVTTLLDNFKIEGPNGTHVAMVFELMGETLLHLIYKHKVDRHSSPTKEISVFPVNVLKLIASQILSATHFMHQKGVIHTDLKPENILLKCDERPIADDLVALPPKTRDFHILPSRPICSETSVSNSLEKLELKIADLGNATYTGLHFTNNIQTRQYRAPEILLDHKDWGALADVWSIGCLIFELLTGDYLFEPNDGASFSRNEDHLAQVFELLNEFPSESYLEDCSNSSKYFSSPRLLKNITNLKVWPLKDVLVEKYKYDPEDDNLNLICDLILKCLRLDHRDRYDCGSLLSHPWFKQDAKYNAEECALLPNSSHLIPGFTREE